MKNLLAFILIGLATFGTAQFDTLGMMRKMKTSPMMLLQMGDVKKELKLTGDQNKKIGVIQKEYLKATQEASKGSRSGDMSSMAALTEATDKAAKAILDTLDPDQAKRFKQIQYQIWGATCLYEVEVQAALQITSGQLEKINEWQEGGASRMAEALQGSGRDMKKKLKEVQEADEATLLEILTSDQAAKYKELVGPPSNSAKRLRDQGF